MVGMDEKNFPTNGPSVWKQIPPPQKTNEMIFFRFPQCVVRSRVPKT